MDQNTGELYLNRTKFDEEQIKKVSDKLLAKRQKLIQLSEEQFKLLSPMDRRGRKNSMRNIPCPCGSGRKYKKCCWYK